MSTSTRTRWLVPPDPAYPDSDGEPLAENTTQYRWIVRIVGGLQTIFRDDPNVFVAGDLFWYPVQGHPEIRRAPDALVVIGRPRGERGAYMQWREEGIAPQVVFEVLSPGNRGGELARKLEFYDQYGVEEYYIYDPDHIELSGYLREGDTLQAIPDLDGWVSPRLGIRFDKSGAQLEIFDPDGQPFLEYLQLFDRSVEDRIRAADERRRAEREQRRAERQRLRAEKANRLAEEQRQRADEEHRLADEERRLADEQRLRAERLAAQLRALGIEPET
jgi:Uma2 family endonuclease